MNGEPSPVTGEVMHRMHSYVQDNFSIHGIFRTNFSTPRL